MAIQATAPQASGERRHVTVSTASTMMPMRPALAALSEDTQAWWADLLGPRPGRTGRG
jgi:hypothetical protein